MLLPVALTRAQRALATAASFARVAALTLRLRAFLAGAVALAPLALAQRARCAAAMRARAAGDMRRRLRPGAGAAVLSPVTASIFASRRSILSLIATTLRS